MQTSDPLRFDGDSNDFLEIRLIDASGPDLLLEVEVRRGGFSGAIETWVQREAWMGFAQDLTILEQKRQGAAGVTSISPDELEIVVRSVSKSGHMAVAGKIGVRSFDRKVTLEFSPMAFDPSQFPQIAQEARTFVS